MDKTTTWFVRGAALIVIIVGWVSYLEPYLEKQAKIKSSREEEQRTLSLEQRCKYFPKISEFRFYDFYKDGLIKKVVMAAGYPIQANTDKGNYLTEVYADNDVIKQLNRKNIPMVVGSNLMCKQ